MKYLLHISLIIACLAFMLQGCKDSTSVFISSGDMEDILYDMHLADAMAQEAPGGYDKNVVQYRAAVLKKYNVSQEKFDTSMVYYMRHTDEMHDIYQHIADRMQNEANNIGANVEGGISAAGDSADVWSGDKSFILLPNQPYNLHSFNLKPDTTFHKGDRLILSFKSDFIFQDGMRDGVVMLAVTLGNDSVVTRSQHLSSSMPTTLRIDDNDSLGIKGIKGFFLLTKNNDANSSATTLQLMSISQIRLIRVHPSKPKFGSSAPVTPSDGRIPVNPAVPDSERMRPIPSR